MVARTPVHEAATPASAASRTALVAIWSASLCWHVGVILYLRWMGYIAWDTVGDSLETVSTLFAPPFAGIGLFYWKGGWAKVVANRFGLTLAVGSALFWNLVLFVLILMVLTGASYIEDAYQLAAKIGTVFVWLVAGSMSYAFATHGNAKDSA